MSLSTSQTDLTSTCPDVEIVLTMDEIAIVNPPKSGCSSRGLCYYVRAAPWILLIIAIVAGIPLLILGLCASNEILWNLVIPGIIFMVIICLMICGGCIAWCAGCSESCNE
jgi:hypothetical protein